VVTVDRPDVASLSAGMRQYNRGVMNIRLDGLTKHYGETVALDIPALTIGAGVFVCTGPVGCGLTTLARLLSGVDTPTSGRVLLGERDLDAVDAGERPVLVSSEATPAPGVIRVVDLPDAASTSWLDEVSATETTVVLATHEPEVALDVGTRIAVLREGRVQQVGAPGEIYDEPVNEFVASFFGRPAINLVPGILEKDGVAVEIGNRMIALAGAIAEEYCRDITVGIRPEHIRLLPASELGWRATVTRAEDLEIPGHVEVQAEGQRMLAAATGVHAVGDPITLRIAPRHLHVFDIKGGRLRQV
jgi:ABC-type sugar transport system ATPase subunit